MPRRKHPIEWTTQEALQRLFHPKIAQHLKGAVEKAREKDEKSTKPKDTP